MNKWNLLTIQKYKKWWVWWLSKVLSLNFLFSSLLHTTLDTHCMFSLYARTLKNLYQYINFMKMALQTHHTHHYGVSYA